MVKTRNNQRSGSEESEQPEQPEIRRIINSEVREGLQELMPSMFEQIKAELAQLIDEKIAAAMQTTRDTSQLARKDCNYKDFSACNPPLFEGKQDPLVTTRWIADVEGAFRTIICPPEVKVHFAVNLLRGAAKNWWNMMVKTRTEREVETLKWEEFKQLLIEQYVPPVEVDKITTEFLSLEQTTESVNEITDKFFDKAMFCPEYMATERMKMLRYSSMLKSSIREFVVNSKCQTLNEMINMARVRELELETQAQKKKQKQELKALKLENFEDTEGNRKGVPTCQNCGKNHIGECRMKTKTCYKCGKEGHISKDCKDGSIWCFNCHQLGHIKINCPKLIGGTAQISAPGIKTEVPKSKGRAFQLKVEKEKDISNVDSTVEYV